MKKFMVLLLLVLLLCSNPLYALQTCNSSINETTPASQFTINGDEVTDNQTGLTWQKCPLGLSGSDCLTGSAQTYSWAEALQAAQSAGNDWRLPYVNELQSIVEYSCYDPAINLAVFPNTASSYYWSASPYYKYDTYAMGVYFLDGNSYYSDKNYSGYVRPVRSGQSFAFLPPILIYYLLF